MENLSVCRINLFQSVKIISGITMQLFRDVVHSDFEYVEKVKHPNGG